MGPDVDELVVALDGRGEWWDLHRGVGDGHGPVWVVTLGRGYGDPTTRTFHDPTISGAIRAAVNDGPPLPVIPRRPHSVDPALFSVVRDGSKWAVHYDGSSAGMGYLTTKAYALQVIGKWVARSAAVLADWDAEWGTQARAGVEGVDYRWGPR